MGGYAPPSAAAQVRPPEDPLSQVGKIVQLKSMLLGQQAQQVETQQRMQALTQTQAMNDAFKNALTPDPATPGKMVFNRDQITQNLAQNGQGSLIPGVTQKFNELDKTAADLQDAKDKHASAQQDYFGSLAAEIKGANYNPQVVGTALAHAAANGYGPQAIQIQQQIAQNPDALKQWVDQAIAGSPKQQELANQALASQARMKAAGKQPEGEQPLPNVDQYNQALTTRYQVLNPGKPLPSEFTLPATATQKDYDRVDKLMESTEKSQGTLAQQNTANAIRQQTFSLAQQAAADRESNQGLTPVIGTDPASGKTVLVPKAAADQMGIKDGMKAGEQEVSKAQAARHWIPLATSPGDTGDPKTSSPESMGILPLIDKLDAEGKLGPVASRWNEFMAGKVGAGDPDVEALRTKMGLSTTLLMNAHVGSRGGSYMLEHFQDLANAGKMDAKTLKSGVKSELNYVQDRAMMPTPKGTTAATPGAPTGPTATGPNGHKIVVKDGKWVDAQTGAAVQ